MQEKMHFDTKTEFEQPWNEAVSAVSQRHTDILFNDLL